MTQEQWYKKLKSFVPDWFVSDDSEVSESTVQALAKVFSEVQVTARSLIDQTFITKAEDHWLDQHGSERMVTRFPEEDDSSYSGRIRYIDNPTAETNIFAQIRAVLNNGEPFILENPNYGYFDNDLFFDDPESVFLSKTKNYNRFTVFIPEQEVDDDSFIKELVLSVIEKNKAFGVAYDIVWGEQT